MRIQQLALLAGAVGFTLAAALQWSSMWPAAAVWWLCLGWTIKEGTA